MIKHNLSNIPDIILKEIIAIKNDSKHGATALTLYSGDVISLFLEKSQARTIRDFLQEFKYILHLLVQSQNTMASIFNLANTLLLKIQQESYGSLSEIKKSISQQCNDYLYGLKNAQQTINIYVNELIKNNSVIFTYSNSSTIFESLKYLHHMGKDFTVYCSEGRPKNEGIFLINKLSEQGINTVLSTDAVLFSSLKDAEIVLIGADSIDIDGVINKSGTYALAMISAFLTIPCYILCAEEKLIPSGYLIPKESLKDPHEIMSSISDKTSVINYYFEHVPFDLFNGIITQKGIIKPMKIRDSIKKTTVHHSFINKN